MCSPHCPPGNYRTQLYDKQREEYQPATPGLGMFVEVKDPEDKVSPVPRRAFLAGQAGRAAVPAAGLAAAARALLCGPSALILKVDPSFRFGGWRRVLPILKRIPQQ